MPRNLVTGLLAILACIVHLPSVLSIPHFAPRGHKGGPGRTDHGECLSSSDAAFLVDIMVSVSVSFDPNFVEPYLADDFSVQSDSINFLLGLPVSHYSLHDLPVFG